MTDFNYSVVWCQLLAFMPQLAINFSPLLPPSEKWNTINCYTNHGSVFT